MSALNQPTGEKENLWDPENRWLPPSPHREAVLKVIKDGIAHVEERGHNIPPLFVMDEGGGVIELPLVRVNGPRFVAARVSSLPGRTKHSDICGTIDELKQLLQDRPELAKSEPERFVQLLNDAGYMISRIHGRCESYAGFATEVVTLCERMKAVNAPEPEEVEEKTNQIRSFLEQTPENVPAGLEQLHELAENVRDLARRIESCLRVCRDSAIEIGRLYENVKGARHWEKGKQ